MKIELNQSEIPSSHHLSDKDVKAVVKQVERQIGERKQAEISVAFVSRDEMVRLNKHYRGKDGLTDVLSFPFDSGGEVILSLDQAIIQAQEKDHSVRDELIFLLVHGLLHIFGYDHEQPQDAEVMFPLQSTILTKLKIDPTL